MDTIYLTETWDLTLDAGGNIAMATDGYALAQDAASAIKTFSGECYYNTVDGVPYWSDILGKLPPVALMRAKFSSAAMSVPEIISAKVFFTAFENRVLSGQVQVTNLKGQTGVTSFSTNLP